MSSLFAFALDIYTLIVPASKRPYITVPEEVKGVDITDKQSASYLNQQDNAALKQLNGIFASAFRKIFASDKITVADVPIVLQLINQIAADVNEFHNKRTAVIEVSRLTVVTFLRITSIILVQMYFGPEEEGVAIQIVNAAFDLLQTDIVPIAQDTKQCCTWIRRQTKTNKDGTV